MMPYPPPAATPPSVGVPGPSGPANVAASILLWARPFMEGCVWTNKRYRHVGDQDEALLYLTAWQFVMADLAASRSLLEAVGNLPVREALARLQPEAFRGSSLSSFVEETGMPRETARRKLSALARRGTFVVLHDGSYRLARLDEDIVDLSIPAFGLARWMLTFHGWPAEAFGTPKALRSHGAFVRSFLGAYIALVKGRRIHTDGISHVPVQLCTMLLQVMKVDRLLQLVGPPRDWGFGAYIEYSLQTLKEPYYLRQIAHIIDLPMATVRNSCRRLADVNGLITLSDGEAFVVGGHAYSLAELGNRRFYSREVEQRIAHFAGHALARARRLSPAIPAPATS